MKKPWNRVDLPVYSVSSRDGDDRNMHICTYVSGVSMSPKRFMVALYKGTRTLELVERNPSFVLQLLAEDQARLVALLGRKSGHHADKVGLLVKRDATTEWKGFTVLREALAWMELSVLDRMDAGDHVMMLCDLVSHRNAREGEPLTLDILRAKGLVRM
jgi:flavin reductase (DIM6/NTAB) family NADH-FMN oxidoreductase RutF